jgi:hypothetical protein
LVVKTLRECFDFNDQSKRFDQAKQQTTVW